MAETTRPFVAISFAICKGAEGDHDIRAGPSADYDMARAPLSSFDYEM